MAKSFSLPLLGSAGCGQSTRVSVISLLFSILLSQLIVCVTPEIIDLGMDMIIDASSDEVHFIRGFLRAPASIDLSNIRWITNEAIVFEFGEDDFGAEDTLAGDFDDDVSYETAQPTFTDPKTDVPVLEPINNEDFADIEESKNEDGNAGDVTEKANIDEEGSGIPPDSTIAPEDTQNQSGNNVNDENEIASESPIPSTESGAENQEEESLHGTTEEVTEEKNDVNNDAGGSQIPLDVNNEDEDVRGDGGELADKDEENKNYNQNSEEAALDTTSKAEDDATGKEEESETVEGENNGDVFGEDNSNGSGEADGDIGINGNANDESEEPALDHPSENQNQMGDDGDGQTETEPIANQSNENEDVNEEVGGSRGEDVGGETEIEEEDNGGKEIPPDTAPVANEINDNEDVNEEVGGTRGEDDGGETEIEEEDNGGKEIPPDTAPVANENNKNEDVNDEAGGTTGEDDGGETEIEEEDNGGKEIPPDTAPVANNNNKNENAKEKEGDTRGEDGGEQLSINDQNGDASSNIAEESTSNPRSESGGNRTLQENEDNISENKNQVVDIALFLLPENCEKDKWGNCDWVTLGVGSYDDEMQQGMSYCCSKDTAFRGVCNSNDIGTLMIDQKKFDGFQRKIQVPSTPLEEFEMDDPVFDVDMSGDYILVIANCNDDGFGIITLGNMEWKSVGGYLPGEIFYMMFVYGAATAIFLVLGLWYYCGMRMFQDAAIPIQKYILASIILGFLGTAFLAIDLLFWNINGIRSNVVMYIAFAMQILFQGLLRCLGVMVAMGWGVVRDTLGMELCKIILLGLLYSGLSLLRYSLNAAASSAQLVSSAAKEELVDIELVLSYVIVCINIIFYCWIISSVKATTEYLRNMNQTSKLRRHLRLRCLIIVSLIIISSLAVVNVLQALASKIDQIDDIKIFKSDNLWIMEAVKYGNYLFIVFGVTILWRPNADAKDYAMQMQIPATEGDENDLELSCVVPSADDMDIGEGYKINDAIAT